MTFLVIIGIIIALAAQVGGIILLIFLGVGVVIGAVCAIIAYINAVVDACKSLKTVSAKNGVLTFLARWWYLFKNSSLTAFKNNFSFAHNALIRAGTHKFLSFKKWMWFIVAPSVIVFGTAMIALFALLQVAVIATVAYIILCLLLIVASIYFIIGFGYSCFNVGKSVGFSYTITNPFMAINFIRGYNIKDFGYFVKDYFGNLIGFILNIWKESVALCSTNIATANNNYPPFNFVRFFYLFSPISIMFVTVLMIAIIIVLALVAFIGLAIAKLFWCLFCLIFK
jgi:hypothetical protein